MHVLLSYIARMHACNTCMHFVYIARAAHATHVISHTHAIYTHATHTQHTCNTHAAYNINYNDTYKAHT